MCRFITISVLVFGVVIGIAETAVSQGLDAATVQEFAQLDRDRSGKLDEREFAFCEVAERLFNGGKREMVEPVFKMIDENGDGGISLPELARSAQNRNARLLDRNLNRSFIQSDTNQDGIIALAEYSDRPNANLDLFGKIDLNDNDKIGPFEWLHELKQSNMENEPAQGFALLDRNDDGAVSREEFEKGDLPGELRNAFEAIDLNGNREIAPGEYAKAISLPAGQIGISPEMLAAFEEIDRNGDHGISFREYERSLRKMGPPPPPRRGETLAEFWFQKIDINRDKEISISEFVISRGGGRGKGKGQ